MPTTTPAVELAAIHARLVGVRQQIGVLRSRGGDRKALGDAAQAALTATGTGTEAGCNAAIRAVANAGKLLREFAGDKDHPNASDVALACKAALPALQAIDWHVKPPLGKVTIVAGPGEVRASAIVPVMVRTALRRSGDLTTAASCGWACADLAPTAFHGIAVFPAGSADALATFTVPPRPGMVDPVAFTFSVLAPFVGLDPTPPAPVHGRLLPPVIVPVRSVVSVARSFDAVVLSPNAPTTGEVVIGRAGDTTAALVVPVHVSGLQDGDLAAPVVPASFAPGAKQASVTLQFGPGTTGAPNRAAHLAIDASGGAFDLADPSGFAFAVREPAAAVLPTVSLTGPGDVTPSATAEVDASATVALSSPTDHAVTAIYGISGQQAGDLLSPTSSTVVLPAGQPSAPIVLRVAPLGLSAPRPLSLSLSGIVGAQGPYPAPVGFSLLANTAPPPRSGAPKPLNPASYANQLRADPSSWFRVTAGLKPNTALGLADGHYGFTSFHVPNVLVYALNSGKVIVDNRVQLHEAGTAIMGLVCNGGLVLDADGTRASRCLLQQSGGVDCVSFQGRDQILDFAEVTGFQSIGIGAVAAAARSPTVYGVHLHGQAPGGAGGSLAMAMIGHSHIDSDQPVNIQFTRVLVEGSRSHDGLETKSSGAQYNDCTVIGCDLMQRHGLVALVARSCWVEQGDIQLNSNNPQAIRCKTPSGIVRVVAGTASVEEVLHKHGGPSLYPYAVGAEVHDHDGKVVVGWARPGWNKPPLRTTTSRCPNLQIVGGAACGQATPIPTDKLPPPPRRLTAADVGPRAS